MNDNSEKAIKASIFSIVGNASLAGIKFLAGYFGNSYALIADAIESSADVFSSIFVFFGLKYSAKPADENHPYGHGKAEALITFLVVTFLIVSAIIIAKESITNIITPHHQPKPFTLLVLGGIILFKELSFQYVMRKSVETNSSSLKADAWHHRSDAITSLMAFIGISISLVMGPGWEAADDVAALFASTFILYNAYKILRPALGEIMDEQLYEDEIEQIREIALNVPGVMATEKCNVRKNGMNYYVDLHAIVDGSISVVEGHKISHDLKDAVQAKMPQVKDVLVHIEPTFVSVREYFRINQIEDKRVER
ncbi:cation diffusion facilitator family transporter [Empedobacter stercoris]|uniref:cation diffusion facilitator family transporter n=1 Tax=Empedobacter TaxID=59734 RepID=UPI0021AE9922|nr:MULTISPECIES: cation diffusion facilitator family transporter [Empedobacter]MDM1522380.1 cation transporter [Empedobacter sp. 225-1]MDM1541555.1 cation transporter [Empedobacter sp. 189-2]UWX65785.1 cation diffusion facilitator family transporter [Empedobacter stercoris]